MATALRNLALGKAACDSPAIVPVTVVCGPKDCGKSTLARHLCNSLVSSKVLVMGLLDIKVELGVNDRIHTYCRVIVSHILKEILGKASLSRQGTHTEREVVSSG